MRIREREDSLYLVRTQYQTKEVRGADTGRGVETGLGCIPAWATLDDMDLLKLRDDITLTAEEHAQLVNYLARKNPPRDPIEMAAYWLEKCANQLAALPLRDRQAKIRNVRPVWNQLSALAGTKRAQTM